MLLSKTGMLQCHIQMIFQTIEVHVRGRVSFSSQNCDAHAGRSGGTLRFMQFQQEQSKTYHRQTGKQSVKSRSHMMRA